MMIVVAVHLGLLGFVLGIGWGRMTGEPYESASNGKTQVTKRQRASNVHAGANGVGRELTR
jgi:hypothetical protein